MTNGLSAMDISSQRHRWRFVRLGGFDQVCLEQAEDIRALDQLDQKLWGALSCPVHGVELDSRTLELVDADKDGRIRAPDVLAAVRWICLVLKDPAYLKKRSPRLPLSAINDLTPEGKAILESARHILANLGKPDATEVSIEDTADTAHIFSQTKFNGDGIVPPDSADDEATRRVIGEIIDCLGPETDRSGKPGVSQQKVEKFFAEAAAFSDWWKKAEADPAVLPLGSATPAAAETLKAVKAKVDDYFTRCRLAAFDPAAAPALNCKESDYAALAAKELSLAAQEVAAFPLARIEPNRPLPLEGPINPAWRDAVAHLRAEVVTPLLGPRASLTAEEWEGINQKFAPYEAWLAGKAGTAVEKLGIERVRQILASNAREAITALIARDKALEPHARAIADVDKAVRYCRDLYTLLNNFVSFRDFYSRRTQGIFQAGRLYLDGRSCDLCIKVEDLGRHSAFAGMSRCYLAYCDCTRRGGTERMTIVAAFTGGDSDFLMVGRNGIFYDRQGQDWDATIVRVIENPISVRQAFWTPYKRVARLVEAQVEKFAASRDQAATGKLFGAIVEAGKTTAEGKPAAQAQAFDIAKFAGIFAAIGLAVGAAGTALAVAGQAFAGLSGLQKLLVIAGVLLVISGPSMLLAYIKLRQRNLGPLLEANGWAINARLKINIPFGASLTHVAALPKGAHRTLRDPYAQKASPWPKVIALAIILSIVAYYLNKSGKLYQWTGIGRRVPAAEKVEPQPPQSTGPEMPPGPQS